MNQIALQINNKTFYAEIYDTISGRAIMESLPIQAKAITWGKEIYFGISTQCKLEEDSRNILEVGELAFYPPMQAFCIFFGPTPMSSDDRPRAADRVNVFGKINSSLKGLDNVQAGDPIYIDIG